jgi:adenine-specific DNA-methyltransferase
MPSLTWIGREAVERHHSAVPFHLLHADPLRSAGDAGSGNLLVEGDNLVALKALLPYYAGQVKCIYIDPPYNTGKQTWSYNDDVSSPVIQEWLKQTLAGHPIDESDLTRHDKWLCMMYPRLVLLRQLLKPDGVIWISIDGTELANLLLLLDEIFYPQNRIGVIVWKNATDNNPTRISIEHEYILCYARDIRMVASVWKEREPLAKRRMLDKYTELHKKHSDVAQIQKEFRKFVRENADELQPLTHYTRVDEHGPYTGSRKVHNPGKDGYHFDVIHPVTGGVCVEPARGYRFPESTYLRLREDGKILFGDDHTQIIQIKEYLADFEGSLKSVINLDGRTGANALQALFGNRTTFRIPNRSRLSKRCYPLPQARMI